MTKYQNRKNKNIYAFDDPKNSGGMKAKDIAGKVGVKLNTVRNIIHYYKIRNLNLNMLIKREKNLEIKKLRLEFYNSFLKLS